MNESLMTVSTSMEMSVVKFDPAAHNCIKLVLMKFEPPTFWLAYGRLTTRSNQPQRV